MSFKRTLIDGAVALFAQLTAPWPKHFPENPTVFVLRNNDIGDLLVVTPLFEALKRRFPYGKIVAGVGPWNNLVLQNNPYVDFVLPISAPWHNKKTCIAPHNSLAGLKAAVDYIWTSPEARALKNLHCDIGIDVLGSPQGSLLMTYAQIPYRLGVRGYAGGDKACQLSVNYSENKTVSQSALEFAEHLGVADLPDNRPQLFLTAQEQAEGESLWSKNTVKRLLIGPGAGLDDKCWPIENFVELTQKITHEQSWQIIIVGSAEDKPLGDRIQSACPRALNYCSQLSLRSVFALTAHSDFVVCNSSMLMHVAAAFKKPTLVVLGPGFVSAKAHERQWGYPDMCQIIGREGPSQPLPSARQAYETIASMASSATK